MKDFNTYKLNLSKSLEDKLFFLKYINVDEYDFILDFGCGTGEVLRCIADAMDNKDASLVGYDTNPEMLDYAIAKTRYHYGNISYVSDLKNLDLLMKGKQKTLIIFNSVLHEMSELAQRKVIGTLMPQFTSVVIRDMKRPLSNEPISNMTRKRVLAQVAPWQAAMFESRWGKIKDKENLYRFFLMNEFVENFETEVEEDYMSVLWSDITWRLESGYNTVYQQSFTLPYRKQQVKKRFNHVMHDITHRKVIYTKKEK